MVRRNLVPEQALQIHLDPLAEVHLTVTHSHVSLCTFGHEARAQELSACLLYQEDPYDGLVNFYNDCMAITISAVPHKFGSQSKALDVLFFQGQNCDYAVVSIVAFFCVWVEAQ